MASQHCKPFECLFELERAKTTAPTCQPSCEAITCARDLELLWGAPCLNQRIFRHNQKGRLLVRGCLPSAVKPSSSRLSTSWHTLSSPVGVSTLT